MRRQSLCVGPSRPDLAEPQTERELDEELRAYLDSPLEGRWRTACRVTRPCARHGPRWAAPRRSKITCATSAGKHTSTLRARPALRRALAPARASLHRSRAADAGARHRRHRRDVQRARRGPPRAAALSRARSGRGRLGNEPRRASRNAIAPANFVVWRERARTLDHLGMVGPRTLAIMLNGQPLQVTGLTASSDVFRALGVQPALGRVYTAEEDGGNDVIVLSHEFWQRALGGRADVLGTALTADGERRTVIGVMPPRFSIAGQNADFLVPYGLRRSSSAPLEGAEVRTRWRDCTMAPRSTMRYSGDARHLRRAREGRTAAECGTHGDALPPAGSNGRRHQAGAAHAGGRCGAGAPGRLRQRRQSAARAERRARPRSRHAHGARRRRGRLVRQMLSESLLLAAAGGIAGLGVAALLHRGLLTSSASALRFHGSIRSTSICDRGLHDDRRAGDRHGFWSRACADVGQLCEPRAARRWAHVGGRRLHRALNTPRRGRGRLVARVARGRRTVAAQLCQPAEHRHRLSLRRRALRARPVAGHTCDALAPPRCSGNR